jgi:C4-dicarboxylate-binding protein DctP
MTQIRVVRSAVLIAAGLLVLALPAEAHAARAVLSHTFAPGSTWGRTNEMLAERIEKATNGRVQVRIHGAGQMYSTYEKAIAAVQAGTIQIAHINASTLANYDKRWSILSAPGVLHGWEHVKRFMETPAYKELERDLEQKTGIKLLLWGTLVPDQVWNSRRPIVTPQDWSGLKIRVAPSQAAILATEALGGSPIVLATPETATAIAQGVVDGGIASTAIAVPIWSARDRLPYATVPAGGWTLGNLLVGHVVNARWWNSLSARDREAITAALPALMDETQAWIASSNESLWDQYKDLPNVTVTRLTDEQTAVWADLVEKRVIPELKKEYGTDLFDAARATIPQK